MHHAFTAWTKGQRKKMLRTMRDVYSHLRKKTVESSQFKP